MSRLDDIFENVRKTKEVMLKNMDALLRRGQKLGTLLEKTESMEQKAKLFAEEAHELQQRAKSRYLATTFILIGFCIGVIYTIIMGYEPLIVLVGGIAGGAVGYSFDFIRNWFVTTFFGDDKEDKPTKSQLNPEQNKLEHELELNLGKAPGILNAFQSSKISANPTEAVLETAVRNRFGF